MSAVFFMEKREEAEEHLSPEMGELQLCGRILFDKAEKFRLPSMARRGFFFWGGAGGVGPMGRQRVWRWRLSFWKLLMKWRCVGRTWRRVRAEAFLRRRRRASSCRLSEGTCGSVPVMAKSARSVFVFCGKTPAWAFDVEGRKGSVVLWGAFRRVWGALLMRQRGTCRGRA